MPNSVSKTDVPRPSIPRPAVVGTWPILASLAPAAADAGGVGAALGSEPSDVGTVYAVVYLLCLLVALVLLLSLARTRKSRKADSNRRLLQLMARRIMARLTSSAATDARRSIAQSVYNALFNEPLSTSEFEADAAWVDANPAAYDDFIRAMGRRLDRPDKTLLLRAGAYVSMADGTLAGHNSDELRRLASRLGIPSSDAETFFKTLMAASRPSGPSKL